MNIFSNDDELYERFLRRLRFGLQDLAHKFCMPKVCEFSAGRFLSYSHGHVSSSIPVFVSLPMSG